MSLITALQPMVTKLQLWVPLAPSDQAAVLALPHDLKTIRPHEFIVREADNSGPCCLLLSGYAYCHKTAGNGGRQIFSIQMKGDVVDLNNSVLGHADYNVQALTSLDVALIPAKAIREIAADCPAVGLAMWRETLVNAAILQEWALNAGRRDARARIAHFLCELGVRLNTAGLGTATDYRLPMTQDQMADALALTSVHVNRMLKGLCAEGLIEMRTRAIRIPDFTALAKVGDFHKRYLHLPAGNLSSSA